MEIETRKMDDVTVVRIKEKKLTFHEAPEMKTYMLGLMLNEDNKILVDLSEVENMDSTGLGSILFGIRQSDQHEKDMRFCSAHDKIRYLIRIAHLEEVIDLYETDTDALKAFED